MYQKKTLLLTLFLSLNFSWGEAQVVVKGYGQITAEQLAHESPVYLYGEWEFYWRKLLTPDDFKTDQTPDYLFVPSSWHRNEKFELLGFATYRMKLLLPAERPVLSLYFPIFNSAGKVWVNGVLAAEVGRVSDDREIYRPALKGTMVAVPNDSPEVEIVVQVANFSYFSSGFPRTPQLDSAERHLARINRANGIENFFAGSLIAMFIYQLILYFLYQRGKPYLWLSLICLGVALRAMIVHGGSFLLPNLYPGISWEIWKKIEFGCVYGIVAIFPLYVYHLFSEDAPRWPVHIFVAIASFLGAAVLFTPQYVYGGLLEVSHIGLLLGFLYAVYSISRAWRHGNRDARIILFGVLVSFPFILMEILKNSVLVALNIPFIYLVEIGVLVFLIFQVYLLSNHYATSYKRLEVLNRDLEKIVEVRTSELSTANKVKDRLLSVMSHDIRSPLNSLRGLLQFYNAGKITKEEFDRYSQHIEDDLGKTSILVENILYWTAGQLKGIEVRKENFGVNAMMRDIVHLFSTIANHKKVTLTVHSIEEDVEIHSDKNILYLVIRNLISNAIKFSHPQSEVKISASLSAEYLSIDVIDQGVGMDQQTIELLLESEGSVSTLGTGNEKGTGLGLALCREYLERIGGELRIASQKGKGSKFSVMIPKAENTILLSK